MRDGSAIGRSSWRVLLDIKLLIVDPASDLSDALTEHLAEAAPTWSVAHSASPEDAQHLASRSAFDALMSAGAADFALDDDLMLDAFASGGGSFDMGGSGLGCQSFTYSTSNKTCTLLSGTFAEATKTWDPTLDCVSGGALAPVPNTLPGLGDLKSGVCLDGATIATKHAASLSQCEADCAGLAACANWTYHLNKSTCNLEGPGAAKGSKAARKKAQDEWLKEAGKPINNLHPLPMSKVKGCAQDRAAQLIRDFPKFG